MENIIAQTNVKKTFPLLSPGSFLVSGLMLNAVIHVELILVSDNKMRVRFHSPTCGYTVSLTPFLNVFLEPLSRFSWSRVRDLLSNPPLA